MDVGNAIVPAELSIRERRILGVLIEKSRTTPDSYPLSLNALTTGCNQKSNRDPLMDLDEGEVEDGIEILMKQGLVSLLQSGRVDRYRHLVYDAWNINKVEVAILAELLLRGPQTEGELRGRASRMEPIDSLDLLRENLDRMAERKMVVFLTPPRARGTTLTHGFHSPEELLQIRNHFGSVGSDHSLLSSTPAPRASTPVVQSNEIAELRKDLLRMQSEIDELKSEIASLKARS
jgi:uncharacterized protein